MMSKNEMKANHNTGSPNQFNFFVGKYDVKERDESKSQLVCSSQVGSFGWQI